MKSRVSVALAFRENVVRLGGNGLGYQEGIEFYMAENAQSRVLATKKVHCHEKMENQYQYEEINIIGTFNTKQQVFSVLKDYTEKRTLCCESLLLLHHAEAKCNLAVSTEK